MVQKKKFTDDDIKSIIKQYTEGVSQRKLAKQFLVDSSVIRRVLKENGVVIRGVSSNGKLYSWNDNYFETIDTEDKAYWLGFLMADGYITNRKVLGVKLAIKDIGHLEKLRDSLDSNIPIHVYESNPESYSGSNYKYCVFNITSKKMYQDLVNKGLTPNKSKTLKFPSIDKELIPHFIRGYFDGDGSIYSSKSGTCVSMLGTKDFLSIVKPVIAPNSKSKVYESKGIHYISLGGNNAKSALKILYDNATIYLDRKYNKYQELVIGNVQRL